MKRFFFNTMILCMLFIAINTYGQSQCGNTFNKEDAKHLIYLGQNHILDSLRNIFFPENQIRTKTDIEQVSNGVIFNIPYRVIVFSDDVGTPTSTALKDNEVKNLMDAVNQEFANNNTSIRFYQKCEITHINSTQYHVVDNNTERDNLIGIYGEPNVLNIHLVKSITNWGGWGWYPWSPGKFNLMVGTDGEFDNWLIKSVCHEIGHCLGLPHTHTNVRGDNGDNKDADNCEQESQRRDRTIQDLGCGLSVYNKDRCEVNGDAFCDTEASPGAISISSECVYSGTTTDNWNDVWTPPTRNYMSYLGFNSDVCRTQFSPSQISNMHSSIFFYMRDAFETSDIYYNMNEFKLAGTEFGGETFELYAPEKIYAAQGLDNYDVNASSTVYLQAGKEINLYPGFTAQAGATFTAVVAPIQDCDAPPLAPSDLSDEMEMRTFNNDQYAKADELIRNALVNVEELLEDDDNEYGATWEINIYPNPSSDVANLNYNFGGYTGDVNYEIMSTSGQTVSQSSFTVNGNNGVESLNISGLPSGIYFVKVEANGRRETLKLVVSQ